MEKTYLFYDVETSGLNSAFDQILTFASIRTDLNLLELERTSYIVKLRKDIIPSPKAFIVHCLTGEMLEHGMKECQAAFKIHSLFNQPGTISVGYNSLFFDDEFLRFLFYRNLLDPYRHQYAKGCYRMDILPITTLYRIFCSSILNWPERSDGLTTLKLDLLADANKFETSGMSHEAMNDVESLLALCKILSEKRDIWNYALGFFDKHQDHLRIQNIENQHQCRIGNFNFPIGIMISASFGPNVNYLIPVLGLGESNAYKNQSLWLRLDIENSSCLNEENDCFDWSVIRKRLGDQWFILPFYERFHSHLTSEVRENITNVINAFRANPELFLKSRQYFKNYRYPFIPDIDVDADLYQSGFFTWEEQKDIDTFLTAEDKNKPNLIENLKQPRVRQLAHRILLRNFPEFIDKNSNLYINLLEPLISNDRVVKGYKNETKFNYKKALEEIHEIEPDIKNFRHDKQKAFNWVKGYIHELLNLD